VRLLLDEHFSERDAEQVRLQNPSIDIVSLHQWAEGAYLAHDDATILAAAHEQGRVLVTRDIRTIAPLLTTMVEAGVPRGGIIFVDPRAIPEGNTGALVRALIALYLEEQETDWTDRVLFLRPPEPA
jgi:hypothetical protein